jgi:hypothetical protein
MKFTAVVSALLVASAAAFAPAATNEVCACVCVFYRLTVEV